MRIPSKSGQRSAQRVDALQAVSHQPTSVSIDANVTAFQLYAGGVFDVPCGTKRDHLVLVRSCDMTGVLWLIMCHASDGATGAAHQNHACDAGSLPRAVCNVASHHVLAR